MKTSLRISTVVLLVAIGLWFGGHPSWLPSPLRSVFVSESANQKLVNQVMGLISKDYWRPVNVQALENTATAQGLEAAVASLDDPYSHYYTPSLYSSFQYEINPEISGIGVEPAAQPVDGGLQIEEVLQGSPAAKAGLRHGDVITAVAGRSLAGESVNKSSQLIRGRSGTKVSLRVLRGKRSFVVSITRAEVVEPIVASKMLTYQGKKIGYVELAEFGQNAASEVRAQVQKLLKGGAQALILDLRDNPGGLVQQAIGVASTFIQHGKIVTTRGRNQPTTVYTALGDALAPKLPMAVLIDRGTASAAEIVTGALKDHQRAIVVGTHTYGKGVFQQIQPVAGGGALDITVGEYFTPNGQNLGAGGVKEGPGIAPNLYVYDNPKNPGTKVVRVAEQKLAVELR